MVGCVVNGDRGDLFWLWKVKNTANQPWESRLLSLLDSTRILVNFTNQ